MVYSNNPVVNNMIRLESEIRELDKKADLQNLELIDLVQLSENQKNGDSFSLFIQSEFARLFDNGTILASGTLYQKIVEYVEFLEEEKTYYEKSIARGEN